MKTSVYMFAIVVVAVVFVALEIGISIGSQTVGNLFEVRVERGSEYDFERLELDFEQRSEEAHESSENLKENDTSLIDLTDSVKESAADTDEEVSTDAEEPMEIDGNFPININLANEEELCLLPSIGEVRAANIIEHREKYGEFTSIYEIMEVSGIGEKIFDGIKDLITIE